MKPSQLKRLIAEVIREVEAEMTPDPKANASSTTEPLPNTSKFKEEKKPTVIKLKVAGLKDSQIKKVLSRLSYQAMQNDLEVIHAEIEKAGGIKANMNPEDLKALAKASGKPDLAPQGEEPNKGEEEGEPEMPPPHVWKNMSKEKRDKFIKPGSHEADWKAATERDSANEKEKLRKRAAMAASGNLDWDDEANRPVDTSLWTDKDWDFYNKDEPTPPSNGDEKYKPNLSKKPAHVKKGVVPDDLSGKMRH